MAPTHILSMCIYFIKYLDLPPVTFNTHCLLVAEITGISLNQIRDMEFSKSLASAYGIEALLSFPHWICNIGLAATDCLVNAPCLPSC